MTVIKIGISSAAAASGLPDYNDVQIVNGVISADLLDVNGVSTGISMSGSLNMSDSATNNNVTGDVAPFVKEVLDYYQFVNAIVDLDFSVFPANESITVSFIGHSSTQSTRDCNLTTNGNTYLYDVSGTTTPNPALVYTETADGSGNFAIQFESTVANNIYLSALQIEYGAAAPSIDTMDDPLLLNSTSAHTVSDFAGSITSAVISRDGISLSGTGVTDTQATWPAQAQGLVIPEPGSDSSVVLSDGTDNDDVMRTFLPESGSTYNQVGTVSGSLIAGDWGFGLGLESNQDGYITRDSDASIATHNNDGSTTWLDYGTSLVYSWDKNATVGDDGGLTSITLNNSESGGGGAITSTPIQSVQISSSTIQSSTI